MPAIWAAGIGAAGSVLGGVLGGSSSAGEVDTRPWKQQREPLKYGFAESRDLYDQGGYEGAYAAPTSPYSNQGIGWGADAAQGAYDYLPGMYGQWGQGLTSLMGQAANYYQGALNPGFNENPYGSEGYMDTMQTVAEYNPALEGQLDAAQRGINRNLNENIMTGIRAGAGATGNTASSRRGIAEGIAMRGANESYADVEAMLRGQNMGRAYDTANQWGGFQQNEAGARERAAGQLSGLGQYGIGLQQQGYDSSQDAARAMMGLGDYQQQLGQQQIAGARAEADAPWDYLNRYMDVVGGQNWGSSTDSSASQANWGLNSSSQSPTFNIGMPGGGYSQPASSGGTAEAGPAYGGGNWWDSW